MIHPEFGSARNKKESFSLAIEEIEKVSELYGDSIAIIEDGKSISYKELQEKSDLISFFLLEKGVERQDLIPLCIDKSIDFVVAFVGIIKIGAIGVPIDPEQPTKIIQRIIGGLKPKFTFITKRHEESIPSICDCGDVSTLCAISTKRLSIDNSGIIRRRPNDIVSIIFTSGTTGTPKGVMISQQNLKSSIDARVDYYKTSPKLLWLTSVGFDASLASVFWPLFTGGTIIIPSQKNLFKKDYIFDRLKVADTLMAVPTYYKFLLENKLTQSSSLERVIVGGEALSSNLVKDHFRFTPDIELFNEYGPTECTIWATVHKIEPDTIENEIGKPLPHLQLALMDKDHIKEVGLGEIGEIFISGEGVSSGYYRDPELTRINFLKGPNDRLWYKTGDLGKKLPNGSFVFLGRMDEQVKIAGHRIELTGIRDRLMGTGMVKDAWVSAKKGKDNEKELIAFVVPAVGYQAKRFLFAIKELLSKVEVPNHIIEVDDVPLTLNGKVDQKRLFDLYEQHQVQNKKEIDSMDAEKTLLSLFIESTGCHLEEFKGCIYEIGVNSIDLIRFVGKMNRSFDLQCSVMELFKAERLEHFLKQIQGQNATKPDFPGTRWPSNVATFEQESLYINHHFGKDGAYHLNFNFLFEQQLEIDVLTEAVRNVLKREVNLRTVFKEEGGLILTDYLTELDWELNDWDFSATAFSAEQLTKLVKPLMLEPFDLSNDFLVRIHVFHFQHQIEVISVIVHHIAFDKTSLPLFMDSLEGEYNRAKIGDSKPFIPLNNISTSRDSHRDIIEEKKGENLAYWDKRLEGFTPTNIERQEISSNHTSNVGLKKVHLGVEWIYFFADVTLNHKTTEFVLFLSAFKVLVYKYSFYKDQCVGITASTREYGDRSDQIGYFINTLPIRTNIDPDEKFNDFLQRSNKSLHEDLYHQLPVSALAKGVTHGNAQSENPFFEILFNFEIEEDHQPISLGGAKGNLIEGVAISSPFKITFSVHRKKDGVFIEVLFDADIYNDEFIDGFLKHYVHILESLKDKINVKIKDIQLVERLDITNPFPTYNLLKEFEKIALESPGSLAVVGNEKKLTYKELNHNANQLAWLLLKAKKSIPVTIMVATNRDTDLIISILAIWKAGLTYIPVNPDFPANRIANMVESTKCSMAITSTNSEELIKKFPGIEVLSLNTTNWNTNSVENPCIYADKNKISHIIFTSGSTGYPKGVMVSYGNLNAFFHWAYNEFKEEDYDVLLATSSASFDLSIFEFFYPLSIGKTVRVLKDGSEILKEVSNKQRLFINTVPSVVDFLITEGMDFSNVSCLNVAGEPFPEDFLEVFDLKKISLRNLYGPAEDTTYSSCKKFIKKEAVTIGKPIKGTYFYILSEDLEHCPIGVTGEICIGGFGLSVGYVAESALTREKFIDDPFLTDGKKIYKTGDLGRYLPNGEIAYMGRSDYQVKLRGLRIELTEIESHILKSGLVKSACVLMKTTDKSSLLVGYVVSKVNDFEPVLKDYLRDQLPNYMIPTIWVRLDQFPLTSNGKTDKNKLLKYAISRRNDFSSLNVLLPAHSTHERIKIIWQELFENDHLNVENNFFELGGHSLLALRLVGKVNKAFELNLSVSDLYQHPSIREMADLVISAKEKGVEIRFPQFGDRQTLIPLSYNQESLWIIDKLNGSTDYHIPFILHLKGKLVLDHFEKAIKSVVDKHEVLRTIYEEIDGSPFQRIISPENWELEVDYSSFSGKTDNEGLHRLVEDYFFTPFNLKRDYTFRSKLVCLPNSEFLWINVFHHIASDGWSLPIFYKEFVDRYIQLDSRNAYDSVDESLNYQYAEYANWQKEEAKKDSKQEKIAFWKQQLDNHKNLKFPELPHSSQNLKSKGEIHTFELDRELTKTIRKKARELHSSPFIFLLSVFNLLIYKISRQEDFCIGVASTGRYLKGSEDLIGYFVNPLPLRCTVSPSDDFEQFHTGLRQRFYDCLDNQDIPFEVIVSEVSPKRTYGVNPIFQVMFSADYPVDLGAFSIPNIEVGSFNLNQTISKFDLTCFVSEQGETIRISLEYSKRTFNNERIQGIADNFGNLCRQVIGGELSQLGEITFAGEAHLNSLKGKSFPFNKQPNLSPLIQAIDRNAALYPDKVCVYSDYQKFTYVDIITSANRFARFLGSRGVGKGEVVGVCMPRSGEYIIAILGILKSGAVYLPIDDGLPEMRIQFMVNDGCQHFVAEKTSVGATEVKANYIPWNDFKGESYNYSSHNINEEIPIDHPAYVIYTSGSTGKPKGVVLTHRNLDNFVDSFFLTPGITKNDKILSVSSVSFDIGILETLLPLVYGASLYFLDQTNRKEPSVILQKLASEGITLMFATPTHWKMLLAYGWRNSFSQLRVISGGEALEKRLADQLIIRCKELWNIYGPTETTIFSTLKRIQQGDESITVGQPINNTEILVLDNNQKVLPRGSEGEITISGAGVSPNYLNRRELSQSKFISHPCDPEKITYLTGDLGYIDHQNELVIVGRKDHQVKIDGFRVELGEIEETLKGVPEIEEAVVLHLRQKEDRTVLAAIIKLKNRDNNAFTPRPFNRTLIQHFQSQLKEFLPYYMVPNYYIEVSDFPLTLSGKIDRIKLEQINIYGNSTETSDTNDTQEERKLIKIWKEVLGVNTLSKHDDFFEIGGNSLYGVKLISKLEQSFGQKIPLSVLFKNPTINKFAKFLTENPESLENFWKPLVPIKKSGKNTPLYIVHGGGLNIHPFIELARRLPSEQPVYGFQALGLDGRGISPLKIKDIAKEYIKDLLDQNPEGPFNLAGYSLGGIIAYEMAQQLKDMNYSVSKLIFFDTYAISAERNLGKWEKRFFHHYHSIRKKFFDLHLLVNHPKILLRIKKGSVDAKWKRFLKIAGKMEENEDPLLLKFKRIEQQYKIACKNYHIQPYSGEVHLIKANIQSGYLPDKEYYGWKPFVQKMNIWEVPGEHIDMLSEKNLYGFAKTLERILMENKTNN